MGDRINYVGLDVHEEGIVVAVAEGGTYDHPFLGLFEPFFPLVFALDLSRLE